jgi:hypothetical protein
MAPDITGGPGNMFNISAKDMETSFLFAVFIHKTTVTPVRPQRLAGVFRTYTLVTFF